MAKIAVLGYGTVGSGVVEVLETNKDSITKRAGREIEVKSVLDLRDFPGDPIQEKIVHDVDVIINDPEIEVVVEVMGGVHQTRHSLLHMDLNFLRWQRKEILTLCLRHQLAAVFLL